MIARDFRKRQMKAYRDEVEQGSLEWHLRSLEYATTGGNGVVRASTVRFHIRAIRNTLKIVIGKALEEK